MIPSPGGSIAAQIKATAGLQKPVTARGGCVRVHAFATGTNRFSSPVSAPSHAGVHPAPGCNGISNAWHPSRILHVDPHPPRGCAHPLPSHSASDQSAARPGEPRSRGHAAESASLRHRGHCGKGFAETGIGGGVNRALPKNITESRLFFRESVGITPCPVRCSHPVHDIPAT